MGRGRLRAQRRHRRRRAAAREARARRPTRSRRPTPRDEDASTRGRSTLSSDDYGLIAKIDLVEGERRRASRPVDYKHGAPRDGDDGPEAWPADRAQVCVQALILRDNGYRATRRSSTTTRPSSACASRSTTTLVDGDAARQSTRHAALPRRAGSRRRSSTARSARAARWSASACPTRPARCCSSPRPSPPTMSSSCRCSIRARRGRVQPRIDDRRSAAAGSGPRRPAAAVRHRPRTQPSASPASVLQVREKGDARAGGADQRDLPGQPVRQRVGSRQAPSRRSAGAEKSDRVFLDAAAGSTGSRSGLGLKNVFLRREQFRLADDDGFCLRVCARRSWRRRSATSGRCCSAITSSRLRGRSRR